LIFANRKGEKVCNERLPAMRREKGKGKRGKEGTGRDDAPVGQDSLLERVLEADNLRRALRQVRRNRGAPGIDGMTVEELPEHLKGCRAWQVGWKT